MQVKEDSEKNTRKIFMIMQKHREANKTRFGFLSLAVKIAALNLEMAKVTKKIVNICAPVEMINYVYNIID